MPTEPLSPLTAWSNFYVIVGSAAAALTGLQFVVMALAADKRTVTPASARAFATPTIIHFCAALLISAVLSAPWHHLLWPAIGIKACGVAGLVYSMIIFRHARHQSDYKPVIEDWIWHFAIPFVTYAGILTAAIVLLEHTPPALFAIGMLQLVILFTGIHNAWDSAVYIAIDAGTKPGVTTHHKR